MQKSDLFSDDNPYYKASYDLPNMSPISWKYTESEYTSKREAPQKPFKRKAYFGREEEKKEVLAFFKKSLISRKCRNLSWWNI
jgi:hypothetical protein